MSSRNSTPSPKIKTGQSTMLAPLIILLQLEGSTETPDLHRRERLKAIMGSLAQESLWKKGSLAQESLWAMGSFAQAS